MRILTTLQTLSVAAGIALLTGCSNGGSAFAPNATSQQESGHHFVSYDSCPATGPIEYVSDAHNSVIFIYKGRFAGQVPCGQITSELRTPYGLYVQTTTHDLYVANYGRSGVLVFHRGQTAPSNRYKDPTGQNTTDVSVAVDGTVIASNTSQPKGQEDGSLSTWIGGPNGGTFVGNFPMVANAASGAFIAINKRGKVYFDDFHCTVQCGEVWSVSCPAGICGAQTQVAGVAFNSPGGMAFDASGDLLVTDAGPPGVAQTFELPNPTPSTFALTGTPVGMAFSQRNHHWFVADSTNHDADEYDYPSGALVGTVPCCTGGVAIGVAVDE